MKKLFRMLIVFGGSLVILWTSGLVIFAENYGVNSGGIIHTSQAVDPYMAITAAGIVGFAGIIVFFKRNILNRG